MRAPMLAYLTAALLVPWLTLAFGWPMAFLMTGVLGSAWLAAWGLYYRDPEAHRRLSPAELAHIRSDPPDPAVKIPWLALLRYRQTYILQWTGSYAALFAIAATAYLVNLAIIHALNPRLEPMRFDASQDAAS